MARYRGFGAGGIGGGSTLTALVPDDTWTTYNTGTILSSASDAPGGGLTLSLVSPSTVSGNPVNMGGVYGAVPQDALGDVNAILDQWAMWLLSVWSRTIINSDLADRHVIACIYNDGSTGGTDAPTATSRGLGCGIRYFSGEWMVTAWTGNGSSWSYVDAPVSSTSPDTEGSRLSWFPAQGTQTRFAGSPITLSGEGLTVPNAGTQDRSLNSAPRINSLAVGVGFETGTGGSAGDHVISSSLLAIDPMANLSELT